MVSNFQQKVYKITGKIPKGKIVTYKHIAEAAGYPKAARAVGNALNKNTNLKIFCHRVIKSNGDIGGYRGGIQKKINILTREGVKIENRRADLKSFMWKV